MNAQQTAADLLSAANHIEQFGWRRYSYGKSGGPCCVRGAIQVAVFGKTRAEGAATMVSNQQVDRDRAASTELLWSLGKPSGGSLPDWNDFTAEGAGQVVQALRDAAKRVFPDA